MLCKCSAVLHLHVLVCTSVGCAGGHTNDECSCVRGTVASRGNERMIGVSLCPCQALGTVDFFFFPFLPVQSILSLVCVVELVSDVYKPDPCTGSGGQSSSSQAESQKACENGGPPGMGWDGM